MMGFSLTFSLRKIIIVVGLLCFVELARAQSLKDDKDSALSWDPPKGWYLKFPYYISGYDNDKRPVVIWEQGKWDYKTVISESDISYEQLKNYTKQFWQTLYNLKTPFEDGEDGVYVIMDTANADFQQLTHAETVRYFLREALELNIVEQNMYKGMIINANFATHGLVRLVKPVGGRVFEKVEVFGSDKNRWIPVLQSDIPKDQLPPWMGGNDDWKPVKVLGMSSLDRP